MSAAPCTCLWCEKAFPAASFGGKPKVFCSDACRHAFQTACRIYTELQVRGGKVSIGTLRWTVATYTTPEAIPPLIRAMPPIPTLAELAARPPRAMQEQAETSTREEA